MILEVADFLRANQASMMLPKLILTAALALQASGTPLRSRQLPGVESVVNGLTSLAFSIGSRIVPAQKAYKFESLESLIPNESVRRARVTYGPFKLQARNSSKKEGNSWSMDPQGTSWAYKASDFPSDITLVHGKMSIELANGDVISNANGIYNHHAFFLDMSKDIRADIQCKGGSKAVYPIPSILGSAADSQEGRELNTSKPIVSGTYIKKDSRIMVTGDLVNYADSPREVYMVADIHYINGKKPDLFEPSVTLVEVGHCEGSSEGFMGKPPPGKAQFSIRGDNLEIANDGMIAMVKGHLHDGGVNFRFWLNGKEICDSKAHYNAAKVGRRSFDFQPQDGSGDGMISGMSGCEGPIDVKKGDLVSMEAFYDVEKHPAREHPGGGMSEAMALGVFAFFRKQN